MGFEPGRITHIREGPRFLGNSDPEHIGQIVECVTNPVIPFRVVPEFRFLAQLMRNCEPRRGSSPDPTALHGSTHSAPVFLIPFAGPSCKTDLTDLQTRQTVIGEETKDL
jgi:hypothetical protein